MIDWSTLQRLAHCQRGGIAVMSAFAITAVTIGTGIAVDYGNRLKQNAVLQSLSDAASVAGARELALSGADAAHVTAVAEQFVQVNAKDLPGSLQINVAVNDQEGSVTVGISHDWSTYFVHLFSPAVPPVTADATARIVSSGKICMIALKPFANKALHVLENAKLVADGCSVYSNSTHNHSIWIDDNGQVTADLICTAGGVKYKHSTSVTPAVTTDCPPVPDPLLDRPAPPSDPCPESPTPVVITNQIVSLMPGTYCGGIKIEGNSNVNFLSGEYVIKDGPFEVTDTSSIRGVNTGFYFTGDDAVLRFDGQTTISLTAPKDGPLASLLFYEDRNAPIGRVHKIESDDARVLLGTIYFPNGTLRVSANSPVADQSAYTAVIAYMLDLDEGPDLVLHSDYSATDIPAPKGLKGGRILLSE